MVSNAKSDQNVQLNNQSDAHKVQMDILYNGQTDGIGETH